MKEVKFRGMDIANNRWLYGNLEIPLINQSKSKHFIIGYAYGQYQKLEVNPKTVGQYTGLKDKKFKEIYEGDIVETDLGKGVVVFDSAAFLIRILEDDEYYGFEDFFSLYEGGCYLVEVISNIFDKLEGEPK